MGKIAVLVVLMAGCGIGSTEAQQGIGAAGGDMACTPHVTGVHTGAPAPCSIDADCGQQGRCVDNSCVLGCNATADCGSGSGLICECGICLQRVCNVGASPDGCLAGETCVSGICH